MKNPETGVEQPRYSHQVDIIAEIVETLGEPASSNAKLYGFNSTPFDFTYLRGVTSNHSYGDPVYDLKRLESHEVDLRREAQKNGNYGGLDKICNRVGIEHGVDVDGADVVDLWRTEDFDLIRDYVEEDVRVTLELGKKFEQQNGER